MLTVLETIAALVCVGLTKPEMKVTVPSMSCKISHFLAGNQARLEKKKPETLFWSINTSNYGHFRQ